MAKQNILIVDADPEGVKVLEVSLKKVGYSVTRAESGTDALELIGFSMPDLIISETKLPKMDGFEFCTKLKENEEWAKIPFIFLTSEKSIEDKIRGLELGVDDYLNKPIFIREILVRVSLGLQRREKERLEHRGSKAKFSGNLQDMGVVDLIQTIDLGHKSGVIHIERPDDEGDVFFNEGRLVDARTTSRQGADAIYRMLVWSEGTFEIEFKPIDREPVIDLSTQGLLMEGMRRLDEWGRLQEQLPPLSSVFDVDGNILVERLGEIPDEVNSILRNFDSRASLLEVVDKGGLGDLEALTVITKLYFEGLITEVAEPPVESLSQLEGTEKPLMDVGDEAGAGTESPIGEDASEDMDVAAIEASQPLANLNGPAGAFVAALTTPKALSAQKKTAVRARVDDEAELEGGAEVVGNSSPKHVPNANDTILGFKAPLVTPSETVPATPSSTTDDDRSSESVSASGAMSTAGAVPAVEHSVSKETAIPARAGGDVLDAVATNESDSRDSESGVSHRNTATSGLYNVPEDAVDDAESNHKRDIAAAIDKEVPPSTKSLSYPPRSDDEQGAYFEATSYAASWDERPSGEPSIPPDDDDEVDGAQADSIPPRDSQVFEDDEMEDYWEEESSGRGKIIAIVVSSVLVLGLTAVGIWIWQQDRAAAFFDNAPIVNVPDDHYQSALKVPTVSIPPQRHRSPHSASGKASKSPSPTPTVGETVPTPPAKASTERVSPEVDAVAAEGQASANENAKDGSMAPDEGTDSASASSAVVAGGDAQAKFNDIMKKVHRGGRAQKIKLLREALTYNPKSDTALSMLAVQLMERKQTRGEARSLAEQAAKINPDNGAAWMVIGYTHQLDGNGDESNSAYERCAACSGPKKYVKECRLLAR